MMEIADNPGSEREAALLSWIQQSAPYGVVTLDESFQVQTWNRWMEQNSGMHFEKVGGKSLFALYPDLIERKLVTYFERALEGESSVLATALHHYLLPLPSSYREAGVAHMFQTARISPLFSEGKVCGVVLVIEDVTQRESQADALAEQHRRDELLSWALAHFLKAEQPRKAIRQLFFKIAEQLDFDTFLVYLRDIDTGELRLEALGGVSPEAEKEFEAFPSITALAGQTGETVVLNSVQKIQDPQLSALKKARVSAAVAIPLLSDGRNLGLLCFATWSRDTILAEETELVKTIAQYLATALDRENTNRQLHKAKEQLSDHAQLLETRVQERTVRLQDTISELETFSYTIAHDLRAPARGITGYCEVMLEEFAAGLQPDARKIVEKIARNSKRMELLTHDLLEFSKVSQQEIVLAAVELEPIIEELVALQPSGVREAITVCCPLHPVRGHRGLLQQILSNLIDNAVKFVRPETRPRITISTQEVLSSSPNTRLRSLIFSSTDTPSPEGSVSVPEKAAKQIRVWVQDEGIGIHAAAHQKIFGIFERGIVKEEYQGTGIGLAIVARAMQRMGGTCGVESELGKGSRFWLELPVG